MNHAHPCTRCPVVKITHDYNTNGCSRCSARVEYAQQIRAGVEFPEVDPPKIPPDQMEWATHRIAQGGYDRGGVLEAKTKEKPKPDVKCCVQGCRSKTPECNSMFGKICAHHRRKLKDMQAVGMDVTIESLSALIPEEWRKKIQAATVGTCDVPGCERAIKYRIDGLGRICAMHNHQLLRMRVNGIVPKSISEIMPMKEIAKRYPDLAKGFRMAKRAKRRLYSPPPCSMPGCDRSSVFIFGEHRLCKTHEQQMRRLMQHGIEVKDLLDIMPIREYWRLHPQTKKTLKCEYPGCDNIAKANIYGIGYMCVKHKKQAERMYKADVLPDRIEGLMPMREYRKLHNGKSSSLIESCLLR